MTKKPTLNSLKADLAAANAEAKTYIDQVAIIRRERDELKVELKNIRDQFSDLKRRISDAEMENQRMRGYIQRVQEDDVVREDLVTTGDPEGEQHMVPKRRPTSFETPSQYSTTGGVDDAYLYHNRQDARRKSKHWITY